MELDEAVGCNELVENTVFQYTVQNNSIRNKALHDHPNSVSPTLQSNPLRLACIASAPLGLVVTIQQPRGAVHRSNTCDGADLPGGVANEFSLDWPYAFGVIRIEVRGGQVYVDGEVVQVAGKTASATEAESGIP